MRVLTYPTRPSDLQTPQWVRQMLGDAPRSTDHGDHLRVLDGGGAALISAHVSDAIDLNAAAFERQVAQAYESIRSVVSTHRCRHPVRFWNHLPAIHQPMDAQRDRYIVFNSARYAVLNDWFGLPDQLPAASGVGHGGRDLVIECLALPTPCAAIENPRQIPAFHYSRRFGPLPPCFSRATVIAHPTDGLPMLLVAGTASIRGEASVHQDDLAGQLNETLINLRALLDAAAAFDPLSCTSSAKPRSEALDSSSPLRGFAPEVQRRVELAAFTDIRVYYFSATDVPEIDAAVRAAFGPATRMEMVQAELCRAELLVEIEGIATLPRRTR